MPKSIGLFILPMNENDITSMPVTCFYYDEDLGCHVIEHGDVMELCSF